MLAPRSATSRVTLANCRRLFDLAARAVAAGPAGEFEGRGLVICGGGPKYLPSLWVCLHMLRQKGCQLPIDIWHFGESEIDESTRRRLTPLDVRWVDALVVAEDKGCEPPGNGYALKVFATLYSRFSEVLLLDADNVALANPAYLFDEPAFRKAGAIFWPDRHRYGPNHPMWSLAGVAYRDEWEVESGQLLVDKRRCLRELRLAWWMNEHAYFWHRFMHGEKDAFRFAWHKLGRVYTLAPDHEPLDYLTFCQHDLQGRRLFQHRCGAKWVLPVADNVRIEGFREEGDCLRWLGEYPEIPGGWHDA